MSKRLPHGWVETRLDALVDITSGVGFPPALQGRTSGDYPFAKVGDVSRAVRNGDGTIGDAGHWVDEQDIKALRARPLPSGSIVFAKIGEAIRQNFRALTTRTLIVDNNVMALMPRANAVDTNFLLQFVRTQDWYPLAVATTVPSLRKTDLAGSTVPLPPLQEQRRIVAKLEALQYRSRRAREALDAVPPLLEKLRQSILAAAFRGDLTRDWRAKHNDVEPASELLRRIRIERRKKWEEAELAKMTAKGRRPTDDSWRAKYTEPKPANTTDLPKLPEGWCWASVEEVTSAARSPCYGVVQPGEDIVDGVPLVRVCDIEEDGRTINIGALRRIPRSIDEEYGRSRLEGGELLISVVGTIGRTAIAPDALKGANIARAVARLVFEQSQLTEWSMYWFNSLFMWHRLNLESREVARKTLNISQLVEGPIPIAPPGEASKVIQQLRAAYERTKRLTTTAVACGRGLRLLERSVEAKAFRGELVPQQPGEEPAEAMLARVHGANGGVEKPLAGAEKRARGRRQTGAPR